MKRSRELHRTEPDVDARSPWLDAAIRATDPIAYLMSLSATEFAVLLAELDARRRGDRHRGAGTPTPARGRDRNPRSGSRCPPVLRMTRHGTGAGCAGK